MLLKNKVAIVTGGASLRGIGWATAKRFAEQGARVAILDLDAAAAHMAASEIGAQHRGYACDVRTEATCQAVVQQIIAEFGQVDILVNNAGVSQAFRLMDSSQADYDLVMDVSVRGAYNMSRAVVPHMRSRKSGAIVCMGSVAAQRGVRLRVARRRPPVHILHNVSLRVLQRLRHRHGDALPVDLQRDLLLVVGGGRRIQADELPVDVAAEQALVIIANE